MKEKLDFVKVIDNYDLVCSRSYNYIKTRFSEEINDFYVAEIDSHYMDGIKLFEHYDISNYLGVNCLICECKRGQNINYAALLVPTGYRYNMSSTVRKHTNSRMVSVADLEFVLSSTNMEYGSINPIGLPSCWKIFIDPKVLNSDMIICGSGLKHSKLLLPSRFLLKLENVEILSGLAKED